MPQTSTGSTRVGASQNHKMIVWRGLVLLLLPANVVVTGFVASARLWWGAWRAILRLCW